MTTQEAHADGVYTDDGLPDGTPTTSGSVFLLRLINLLAGDSHE